ncbi:MAG TPA: class I SAM-dependent methyltransferase [Candidatus Bipolaricaulota bacterium]|nr:class I SAM-dependent methyltransferase [Candidatus Bipolaricaulota bacterium]
MQGYKNIASEFSATRQYLWPELLIFKKYLKNGQKILDLGCGNGRLVKLFDGFNVDYLGLDVNEELIKLAKEQNSDKNFATADILSFDANEKFDLIFMVAVLNHFNKAERKIVLDKVYSALKPGGYLLMTNWNMLNLKNKKSWWRSKHDHDAVITNWGEAAELVYYVFSKRTARAELKDFNLELNLYFSKGQRTNFLFGNNLVTVARKVEVKSFVEKESRQTAAAAT